MLLEPTKYAFQLNMKTLHSMIGDLNINESSMLQMV